MESTWQPPRPEPLKELRRDMFASTEFSALYFMCKSKIGQTEMNLCRTKKVSWPSVQNGNEQAEKHGKDMCSDLGGQFKCMKCGNNVASGA